MLHLEVFSVYKATLAQLVSPLKQKNTFKKIEQLATTVSANNVVSLEVSHFQTIFMQKKYKHNMSGQTPKT